MNKPAVHLTCSPQPQVLLNKALNCLSTRRNVARYWVFAILYLAGACGAGAGPGFDDVRTYSAVVARPGITRESGTSCRIAFKKGYGSDPAEFAFLTYLTTKGDSLRDDIHCGTLIGMDALDQIARLARRTSARRALAYLLFGYQSAYFLDGEYAQSYGETYLAPTLLSLTDIDRYLSHAGPDKRDALAHTLADTLRSPFTDLNEADFLRALRKRGGANLAKQIKTAEKRLPSP